MMSPFFNGRSLFSPDFGRVMNGMDEMFDSMLGDMLYDPFPSMQRRISRPRYLLQGTPSSALSALAPSTTQAKSNALGITQDDTKLQIAVEVPGAKASDINLELNENGRVLTISGETKREEGGISMHSSFQRMFTLGRDVDTTNISAQIDNGVLTITAPKVVVEEAKENVRKIDIVENKMIEGEGDTPLSKEEEDVDASSVHQKEEGEVAAKSAEVVDESVIDLDVVNKE